MFVTRLRFIIVPHFVKGQLLDGLSPLHKGTGIGRATSFCLPQRLLRESQNSDSLDIPNIDGRSFLPW